MITYEQYRAALIERHGEEAYEKLRASSAAVAGLGGLGSNIALCLARAGIGRLYLVDFDRVDITNLNRQQYDVDDIGTLKTEALTKKIKRVNPFIEITCDSVTVTADNAAALLGGHKIICEAFDKAESKAMLVNTVLSDCPESIVISGSGMAGIGDANSIKTRRINDRFYLCGDTKTDCANEPLFAPRVALCAAHQACAALQIILGREVI